ncbi:SRPBCC family protein [Flavobacterium sp. NG2]|uniref:SRPBCC family protein n=1 Tax=Flavobacterium sp. NG2 TaxID=3097547 RepID=UPI002A8020E0|nr:SRPBCC family protein [Flavobacterium sp. NG2]WPR71525.1 SRPBCC family protein [Flavobacterium sp. NG2]
MRIIKYLFLLFLLSLVALSIFIATQKGEFNIERSKIINSSKSSVYNYINDYKNWEDFGSWMTDDPEMKLIYAEKTIGPGASYSWEGKDGNGEMKTLFVKENDSISQKMTFNDSPSTVNWSFKDTIGGTKVTWRTKGKMSFFFKIYAALKGGPDKIIGQMYEKSLDNLDKALDHEINTYSIKENGLVKRPNIFYLAQTFTCEIDKVIKNTKIVIPKITNFCQENNISINGKPFVIYHSYDLDKKITKVSICLPIKSEIFISPGSDINSGKLETTEAVKTTLYGDYSHIQKALDKGFAYLNKNQHKTDPAISHIESFVIGRNEIKNASKWETQIFIPLAPKIAPAPKIVIPPTETYEEREEESTVEPLTPVTSQPLKITKPIIKKIEPKKIQGVEKKEEHSEF